MDKIQKVLDKLSGKEKGAVKKILEKIFRGELQDFDVKKLKGQKDIYRIRKGKLRIIYCLKDEEIFILALERRNDNTYNF